MTIYIIIIILTILLGYCLKPNKNQKNKKIYIIIIFSILAIVAAIRNYTVGVDTPQFCDAFEKISRMTIEQAEESTRYEIGFITLCKLLSYITTNYQILIIVTSLFIMFSVGQFIYKESKDCILSSLLFILLNCYAMYMNVMRQAIAISIILLGYTYFFKNNKIIKYFFTIIFASLFHQSAIIMIVTIFLQKLKFKNKYFLITIIISGIIFVFANPILNLFTKLFTTYSGYLESQFAVSNYFASVLNALVAIIFFVIGICYNKNKFKEKDRTVLDFYAFMIMLNVIFFVFIIKISIFSRLTTYFNIFNILLIPEFIRNIQKKEDKRFILLILLLCTLFYWGIISIYRPEWHGVVPYKTFFE